MALIVTIIVLIILAGISISMLTGNNGIVEKAVEAGQKTTDAQSKEELKLAIMSASIDYYPKEFWTCMPDVGKTLYHLTYGSSTSSVFRTATSGCSGLRPIVSIQGVKMEKSGNTWEIKD